MDGMTCVIHTAGLAHVFNKSKALATPFKQVNEIGTANVARAAVMAGVQHVIVVSSVSVYGNSTPTMCDEDSACLPVDAYAESKWRAELRAIEATRNTTTALSILRMATIYGEDDPGNISRLIGSIDRRRFVWIGDGRNRKSLIHRQDAARACVMAVQHRAARDQLFVITAPACTMLEIVSTIADALGCQVYPIKIPATWAKAIAVSNDRMSHWLGVPLPLTLALVERFLGENVYNGDKIARLLGFQPQVNLTDGIRREVQWYHTRLATS
jgi:nucleoside-diphosphate-sugar epimerase